MYIYIYTHAIYNYMYIYKEKYIYIYTCHKDTNLTRGSIPVRSSVLILAIKTFFARSHVFDGLLLGFVHPGHDLLLLQLSFPDRRVAIVGFQQQPPDRTCLSSMVTQPLLKLVCKIL